MTDSRDLVQRLVDALKGESDWINNPEHDVLIAESLAYLKETSAARIRKTMSKYTKLQLMLAEGMGCKPEDPQVAAAIEKTAEWFEIVLETMGLQPTAIPALVRWQHWHSVMSEEFEEDE